MIIFAASSTPGVRGPPPGEPEDVGRTLIAGRPSSFADFPSGTTVPNWAHLNTTMSGVWDPDTYRGVVGKPSASFLGGIPPPTTPSFTGSSLQKNDEPRLDFYTIHRGGGQYDTDYVKKCNGDLNNALIFVHPLRTLFVLVVGLFSAAIDVHSRSDPTQTSSQQRSSVQSSPRSTSPLSERNPRDSAYPGGSSQRNCHCR